MRRGCLAALVLLALPLSPFWIHPLLNNRKLSGLQGSFDRLKHPAGTIAVRRESDVGLLVGNSNHCDFFVGQVRTYEGTQQKIRSFYRGARAWSPLSGKQQPLEDVVFLANGKFPAEARESLPYSYRSVADWSLPPSTKGRRLYLVYFLDVGEQNYGCDLRCN